MLSDNPTTDILYRHVSGYYKATFDVNSKVALLFF